VVNSCESIFCLYQSVCGIINSSIEGVMVYPLINYRGIVSTVYTFRNVFQEMEATDINESYKDKHPKLLSLKCIEWL
jgi:hypothetical protein